MLSYRCRCSIINTSLVFSRQRLDQCPFNFPCSMFLTQSPSVALALSQVRDAVAYLRSTNGSRTAWRCGCPCSFPVRRPAIFFCACAGVRSGFVIATCSERPLCDVSESVVEPALDPAVDELDGVHVSSCLFSDDSDDDEAEEVENADAVAVAVAPQSTPPSTNSLNARILSLSLTTSGSIFRRKENMNRRSRFVCSAASAASLSYASLCTLWASDSWLRRTSSGMSLRW